MRKIATCVLLAAMTLAVFTSCEGFWLRQIANRVDDECPVYYEIYNVTLRGAEYSDKQIILRFSINERVTPMELNREDVSYAQWMSTLKEQWKWMWDPEKKDFFNEVAEWGGGVTFKFMGKQTGMVREIAFTNEELKYLMSPSEESSSEEQVLQSDAVENADTFNIPPSWQEYSFDDYYSICIPNTMEYVDDNKKAILSEARGIYTPSDLKRFVYEGFFSDLSSGIWRHYASISLSCSSEPSSSESITLEDIDCLDADVVDELNEVLRMMVFGENNFLPLLVDNYQKIVGEPTYRWITVDGTKAIEIKYRRTGNGDFITRGTLYLLNKKVTKNYGDSSFPLRFTNEVMVFITVAYREQEAYLWQPDLDNVIKTFKWNDADTTP